MKTEDKNLPRIAIVDYGMGNLLSISKALEKVGSSVKITADKKEMESSNAILLPGVGAFRDAIAKLSPFSSLILKETKAGKPILGICLGLQLMFTESTEGGRYKGLNLYEGRVVKFPDTVKVPHIGWNNLKVLQPEHPLFRDVTDGARVYFVHSFYGDTQDQDTVIATSEYGVVFPAAIAVRNVLATQFHPEKSGKIGLQILRNFVAIVRQDMTERS